MTNICIIDIFVFFFLGIFNFFPQMLICMCVNHFLRNCINLDDNSLFIGVHLICYHIQNSIFITIESFCGFYDFRVSFGAKSNVRVHMYFVVDEHMQCYFVSRICIIFGLELVSLFRFFMILFI